MSLLEEEASPVAEIEAPLRAIELVEEDGEA
jgi:hypothetical protein